MSANDAIIVWINELKAGHRAPIEKLLARYFERLVQLALWDVASGEEVIELPTHYMGVTGLAFSEDGWRLAAGRDHQRRQHCGMGRDAMNRSIRFVEQAVPSASTPRWTEGDGRTAGELPLSSYRGVSSQCALQRGASHKLLVDALGS